MGLNEEIYESLEKELKQHHIEDMAEDLLLELAEMIADEGGKQKKITVKLTVNKIDLTAIGHNDFEEEEGEVYIESLSVDGKVFLIEDYVL